MNIKAKRKRGAITPGNLAKSNIPECRLDPVKATLSKAAGQIRIWRKPWQLLAGETLLGNLALGTLAAAAGWVMAGRWMGRTRPYLQRKRTDPPLTAAQVAAAVKLRRSGRNWGHMFGVRIAPEFRCCPDRHSVRKGSWCSAIWATRDSACPWTD